jgi:hypothetical protein
MRGTASTVTRITAAGRSIIGTRVSGGRPIRRAIATHVSSGAPITGLSGAGRWEPQLIAYSGSNESGAEALFRQGAALEENA